MNEPTTCVCAESQEFGAFFLVRFCSEHPASISDEWSQDAT